MPQLPYIIPPDLKAAGFIIPPDDAQDTLFVSSAAMEKQGKSHFACTAPDPIGYLSIDLGTKSVADKFKRQGKKIWLKEFMPPKDAEKELKSAQDKMKYWKSMKDAIYSIIDNKQIRTGITDTMTEFWIACRLGHLGKLTQVKAHHYDAPNDDFRSLLRDMQMSGKNWLMLHKKKKAYVDNDWDGKSYERAGFADMGFMAEVNIQHFRATAKQAKEWSVDLGAFCFEVVDCRQNGALAGAVYAGNENCTFQQLALEVYPESDPENWL